MSLPGAKEAIDESSSSAAHEPSSGWHAGAAMGGVARVLAGQGIRLFLSVVSLLYIAAVIGPAARGALTVLMAVSGIVSVICLWGMNGATTYMLSSGQWTGRESLLLAVVWAVASACLSSAAFWAVQLTDWGHSVLSGLSTTMLSVSTVGCVIHTMQSATLIGLFQYTSYSIAIALPALLNLAIFLALRGVGTDPGQAALLAWSSCNMLAAVPLMVGTLLRSPGRIRFPQQMRFAVRYGTKTAVANILNLMTLRLDVLLLRSFAGAAATGSYGLAVQISEVSWLLPQAIGTVIFPKIAQQDDRRDGHWTSRICRLTVLLVGSGSVLLAGFGSAFILLFMPAYSAAIPPLWIMVPGAVSFAVARVIGSDLFGRALPSAHMRGASWSIVVTLVANLALVPVVGAIGAAVASTVAYLVYAWRLLTFFSVTVHVPIHSALVPSSSDSREMWRAIRRLASAIRVQPTVR